MCACMCVYVLCVFACTHLCMHTCVSVYVYFNNLASMVHYITEQVHTELISCVLWSLISTVKPVYKDHPKEQVMVVSVDRWSLCRCGTVLI